jgi:hypothetical protein
MAPTPVSGWGHPRGLMLLAAMQGGKVRACLAEPNIAWEVARRVGFLIATWAGADEVLRQHQVFPISPSGMEPAQ